MRFQFLRGMVIFSLIASALGFGLASASEPEQDMAGGSDHPVLSRYAGSYLYGYGNTNYGKAVVIARSGKDATAQEFEGKISNKLYYSQQGKSPLEVFRNYQAALKNASFTILYQCEVKQCKESTKQGHSVYSTIDHDILRAADWVQPDRNANNILDNGGDQYYYLSAQKIGSKGNVTLQIVLVDGDNRVYSDSRQRVQQFVQIIEETAMEMGKVTVNAEAISNALKQSGKIALYGITFDTNKATIKTESAPALEQMAKVLKDDPTMKVYIVGHTDNQGTLEANQTLSQHRAEAVVTALSTQYGIPVSRMTARGVANLSPVASNSDEDGRSKNRRVELVLY
jgi:outer membrane protein OmpA-like peptidoglycan-associated protein